jgi:hypothetical protein
LYGKLIEIKRGAVNDGGSASSGFNRRGEHRVHDGSG